MRPREHMVRQRCVATLPLILASGMLLGAGGIRSPGALTDESASGTKSGRAYAFQPAGMAAKGLTNMPQERVEHDGGAGVLDESVRSGRRAARTPTKVEINLPLVWLDLGVHGGSAAGPSLQTVHSATCAPRNARSLAGIGLCASEFGDGDDSDGCERIGGEFLHIGQ